MNIGKLKTWHHLGQSGRLLKLSVANLAMGPIEHWNLKIQGALEHTRPCHVRGFFFPNTTNPSAEELWIYKSLSNTEFSELFAIFPADQSNPSASGKYRVWFRFEGMDIMIIVSIHKHPQFQTDFTGLWFGDIEYTAVPRNKVRVTYTQTPAFSDWLHRSWVWRHRVHWGTPQQGSRHLYTNTHNFRLTSPVLGLATSSTLRYPATRFAAPSQTVDCFTVIRESNGQFTQLVEITQYGFASVGDIKCREFIVLCFETGVAVFVKCSFAFAHLLRP